MAKGQQRSNREAKKPKANKKAIVAPTNFLRPTASAAPAKPETKK